MLAFTEHDFRPVILGGDITAYSLVRTLCEAYRVKSLVVNMTRSGGQLDDSKLCDRVDCKHLDTMPAHLHASIFDDQLPVRPWRRHVPAGATRVGTRQ